MIPTPIGLAMMLIGGWLLFQPVAQMLGFVIWASLFSGASAIDAPVLGHSSIPPVILALALLGVRLIRSDARRAHPWLISAAQNAWLLVFCFYAALTSEVLPRIFSGRMNVLSMAQATAGYVELQPSSQNLTQAFYLLSTGFAAFAATIVADREASQKVFFKSALWLAWLQVFTGLLDLAASAAHIEGLFSIFRNGAYAQLSQDAGGLHRISGLEPEPSAYAALSFTLFAVMCECWLRNLRPRATGAAALALVGMLVLSTSSTAFASLAVYAIVLIARMMLFPRALAFRKSLAVFCTLSFSGLGILVLAAVKPAVFTQLQALLVDLTINKSSSESGIIRGLAAKQGWDALVLSRGLGIGVGSFRSSGLIQAIAGSVGAAGLFLFCVYCVQILAPLDRATFYVARPYLRNLAAVALWGALLSLIPALFSSSGADPGPLFAVFAGLAIGWRHSQNARDVSKGAAALSSAAFAPS